jgi:hypothetical protein
MLFGMVGLLGLFPGRTASLPGVLLRRQLRAAEPWPDRFGILLRSVLERGPMHERFSTTANAASIHFRAVTRHLFSRDAEYDRERLSWRCVDRRREEPAARRRAIDGPRLLTLRMYRPCARRRSPRSPSPRFIVRRVSDERPGSRRVPLSFPAGSAGELCGHRLRHSSKRCSPRQRRLDQKRWSLLAQLPRRP